MNQELLRTIGADLGAAQPTVVEQLMPPASRIFLQTHILPMLMRDGQVREIYLHLRTQQGERLPVMVNIASSTSGGKPCYVWALFVAHERSRFEVELIKSRNRSEASAELAEVQRSFTQRMANASGRAIAFFDLAARCRFASSRFAMLTGRSVSNVQNCAWHEVFDTNTRTQHRRFLETAMRGEDACTAPPLAAGSWHAAYISSRNSAGIVDGCFMVEQNKEPE